MRTVAQLIKLEHQVQIGSGKKDQKKIIITVAVFLDVTRAYDGCCCERALYKIHGLEISSRLYSYIEHSFERQTF
jgi:hypothetical protein